MYELKSTPIDALLINNFVKLLKIHTFRKVIDKMIYTDTISEKKILIFLDCTKQSTLN